MFAVVSTRTMPWVQFSGNSSRVVAAEHGWITHSSAAHEGVPASAGDDRLRLENHAFLPSIDLHKNTTAAITDYLDDKYRAL
jgi:hypothetical protein